MKVLIIFLLSFNSFGQDTCACTRLDKRLRHDLDKYAIKLFDDQHKRENTKEIKSFRFQLRTFKAENKTLVKQLKSKERMYNDRLDFVSDSLNSIFKLEKQKTKDSTKLAETTLKKAHKAAIASERKKINWNVFIRLVGIFACLVVVLVIVWKIKH